MTVKVVPKEYAERSIYMILMWSFHIIGKTLQTAQWQLFMIKQRRATWKTFMDFYQKLLWYQSLKMAVINIASIAQINKVNQMLATFVINISLWELFLSGAHNVVQKTNVCLEDCVCKPTSNWLPGCSKHTNTQTHRQANTQRNEHIYENTQIMNDNTEI